MVFFINLWVCGKLFRIEYLDQLQSIEGAFIGLTRYIYSHWPTYEWLGLWYGGFPFAQAYQPGFHYTAAILAKVPGLSPAHAFHVLGGITYSLGGVAFYYLAKALSRDRAVSFLGAFAFSVFSPSVILPSIRRDIGGVWHARRLQTMVAFGESPHVAGLMLGILALALLHRALERRTTASFFLAAFAMASVPATNWPATVELAVGVACYVVALNVPTPRIAAIAVTAYVLALPFALPSTIRATFQGTAYVGDTASHGPWRWIVIGATLLFTVVLRYTLGRLRASFGLRFAAIWTTVLAFMVLPSLIFGVNVMTQVGRFHLALEAAVILTVFLSLQFFLELYPPCRASVLVVIALFCCFQGYQYHRYARGLIQRLNVAQSIEYQEAMWFDGNMHGERVLVPGTISFWLNAFTDTPQMTGCCQQSVLSKEDIIQAYVTAAGYHSEAESADYSLLWMKAWAVAAVSTSGPEGRERYHAFQFPYRFRDRLPLAWSSGDDYIYRVPQRVPGLARAVRATDIVKRQPENGIDVGELRPFVAALDNADLPVASWRWNGPSSATIKGAMNGNSVVSVAMNYHSGWHATVAGTPVPVHADGLGLTVVEPHCTGPCTIEMRWLF